MKKSKTLSAFLLAAALSAYLCACSASKTENDTDVQDPAESFSADADLSQPQETPASESEESPLPSETPNNTDRETAPPEEIVTVEDTSQPETEPFELYPNVYADSSEKEYADDKDTVYLTFDDGPSKYTEEILKCLELNGVKATFFVVPRETEECERLLRMISDAGHTIGIHSYTHDYKAIYASPEAYLEDFAKAFDIVYNATGTRPALYRFPGGSVNNYNRAVRQEIIDEMDKRGFVYFDWNVDSNDWRGYDTDYLYEHVTADAFRFYTPVILFHDTKQNTAEVIDDIIKAFKDEGYSFSTLSDKETPVQF